MRAAFLSLVCLFLTSLRLSIPENETNNPSGLIPIDVTGCLVTIVLLRTPCDVHRMWPCPSGKAGQGITSRTGMPSMCAGVRGRLSPTVTDGGAFA